MGPDNATYKYKPLVDKQRACPKAYAYTTLVLYKRTCSSNSKIKGPTTYKFKVNIEHIKFILGMLRALVSKDAKVKACNIYKQFIDLMPAYHICIGNTTDVPSENFGALNNTCNG